MRKPAIVIALILTLASSEAHGNPITTPVRDTSTQDFPDAGSMLSGHMRLLNGPGVLIALGDGLGPQRSFILPRGTHIVDPTDWKTLDDAFKSMKAEITRKTAENESFRKSAAGWKPGWKILLSAAVAGFSAGVYVGKKL